MSKRDKPKEYSGIYIDNQRDFEVFLLQVYIDGVKRGVELLNLVKDIKDKDDITNHTLAGFEVTITTLKAKADYSKVKLFRIAKDDNKHKS